MSPWSPRLALLLLVPLGCDREMPMSTAREITRGKPGDRFGQALGIGGGDTTLVVGAPGAASAAGEVYLYPPDLTDPMAPLSTLRGVPQEGLGTTVLANADLTGDGQPDLLMGAERGGDGGLVLVPGPVPAGEMDSAAAARFEGESGAKLGWATSVVQAAEAGTDAIVVAGAPGTDGNIGAAWILQVGTSGGDIRPIVALPGAGAAGQAGWSVASGDWNGDGSADVAVGAPWGEEGGVVRVYWGPYAAPDLADPVPSREADVIFTSPEAGAGLGYALASGDVNGDGTADLAMSAPLVDGGKGAVWVVSGAADFLTRTLALQDSSVRGDASLTRIGLSLFWENLSGEASDLHVLVNREVTTPQVGCSTDYAISSTSSCDRSTRTASVRCGPNRPIGGGPGGDPHAIPDILVDYKGKAFFSLRGKVWVSPP